MPGNWKKPKRNYVAADGYSKKIRVWRASRIFDFVNDFFFSKDSGKSSGSGNPIDSFHPLVVPPKNKCKVEK